MSRHRRARVAGRYEIHDRIASGGMAAVHLGRARGAAGFSRTVAVKVLHADAVDDPELVQMLVDEARLVARIHHPNVVALLDVVEDEGAVILVMEYVHGSTIATLVREGEAAGRPAPPEIVAAVASNFLHGLHAAHTARDESGRELELVHRDVSPQNIIVGLDGVARVVDFGVAKAVGRVRTTRDGSVKGKLAYMAPEQLRGTTLDRRVDVFAAATVIWEMLAGRHLFRGGNEGETIHNVLAAEVAPPSAYGAHPALDAVVLKGLARNPADRYATAREMALAVERAFDPAGPSAVGAWVEGLAGDILDERARLIAAIESEAPLHEAAPANVKRARRLALVAVTALVGCGGAALLVAHRLATKSEAAGATSAIAASPGESEQARAQVASEASASLPAPSTSASPEVVGAAKASVATHPAVHASSRTAKPGCDPPYVRDERGRKMYKRACL